MEYTFCSFHKVSVSYLFIYFSKNNHREISLSNPFKKKKKLQKYKSIFWGMGEYGTRPLKNSGRWNCL